MSGYYNRSARRSGGYKKAIIRIDGKTNGPTLCFACFERRHNECVGDCRPISPDKCECKCKERK